jgi:hydrogenase nickel incorporation protein HypB
MSSPGAGKTTTLTALINKIKDKVRVGVMEADIDSNVDAIKIAEKTGVKSIQLHTNGMCHLDAGMTKTGLDGIDMSDLDLIFLENVGNLVCPAEFDTGASLDVMILSIPEGDDKPLKYPLVFEKSDLVIINKIDALPYFDFNLEKCMQSIKMRNKNATIIPISAKTGEGVDLVADYFINKLRLFKEN